MGEALLQLVPLALAAAVSSVPITATIFILLSDTRKPSGLAFLAGTALGTFAAVTLATVAGQAIHGRPRQVDALIGKLEVVIGIALVLLGVFTLVRRTSAANGRAAGWLNGIGEFGVLPVFGIGLALNVRPKGVLLVAAAGLAISRADLLFDENLVLVIVYTLIATATVTVPIVAAILFPRQMDPRLLSAKGWIAAHSTTVGAAMMILVGAFAIGIGLAG